MAGENLPIKNLAQGRAATKALQGLMKGRLLRNTLHGVMAIIKRREEIKKFIKIKKFLDPIQVVKLNPEATGIATMTPRLKAPGSRKKHTEVGQGVICGEHTSQPVG